MSFFRVLIIVATIAFSASASPAEYFFQDQDRDRKIPYRVWLPDTKAKVPLVVLSHGSGGEYANHYWLVDGLVRRNFAVLALNHPGDTSRDQSENGVVSVWKRPLDISRLLDYVLEKTEIVNRIDEDLIFAAGFSSGGYAVLALAGAVYDAEKIRAYCSNDSRGSDCELVDAKNSSGYDYSKASHNYYDSRIRAVYAMAPAVGPAITQLSLEAIKIPVFLAASEDDEVLDPSLHAKYYAKFIPRSALKMFPDGGHFLFLQCTRSTRIADWFIRKFELCAEKGAKARKTVWPVIVTSVSDFFEKSIAIKPVYVD